MTLVRSHRWNVSPQQAREIQLRLRKRLILQDRLPRLRLVAGADVAIIPEHPGKTASGRAIAGVIVYRFPQMEEVERASAVRRMAFPYIPGLLSFREVPALLAAFSRLRRLPDLIFCDAQGYAHPRRFGLACHLGVLLNRPTIGVAKSVLVGEYREPSPRAGSSTPLVDPADGETIGAAVRTADGVKPVYVSAGHRISLSRAVELALAVSDGYRIPRPTREADHYVRALRRAQSARPPVSKR